jgi:EAL domain-containing protein (putative c-di-GMP-specific phosphodiesterase class I)
MRAVDGLRTRGVRLAVDDAGAGYSGLQHILRLRPDLIKLDLSLTRNINQDLARRALAAALVNFSVATDSEVVAEGVETAEEMDALRDLGVQKAQGYYLGKPSPFSEALCSVQYGRAWSPARAAGFAEPQGRQASPAACELCAIEYGRP